MAKRTFAIFALIYLTLQSFAFAQTAGPYRIPREVNLERTVRRSFPGYFNTKEAREGYRPLETDRFYPIGWSRDGKFAYYVEPVDEACGCYYAELRIQDLKTDAVHWEFENKPEERTNANGEPLEDNIDKLWKRNQALFDEKLREHGIQQIARFVPLGPSFSIAGRPYTTDLGTRKEYDQDFGLYRVRNLKLELSSPRLGRKTIYSADNKDEKLLLPLNAAVAGAFKSPFENRAAIIIVNVHRGWEGPPHTVGIQIVGADLKKGFKK